MNINQFERETVLYSFWERTTGKTLPEPVTADEWNKQAYYLAQSGVGMEEALAYLYKERPVFDVFMRWVEVYAVAVGNTEETYEGDVLTKDDWDFWNNNGYLIIRNAVPIAQCYAAKAAIWEYLGADPTVPDTWYKDHPDGNGMMLRFFQHSALHSNRHSPKIRKVFQELYGGADIYLRIDKVSFNPPETDANKFKGSALHWDVSLQTPIPFVLQGLLYLNDVAADDGAFHCVPGFHRQVENWLAGLPEHVNPREVAPLALQPVAVAANAGDLIIWQQALPHCATPNRGTLPRMVQYITYVPVNMETSPVWK